MDIFLDEVWLYLFAAIQSGAFTFDKMLSLLHFLGPAPVITLLALLTVAITKFCSKTFKTKRYIDLEKDFKHWLSIREEALECDATDKGKRMARNIDQAKLNRVYYDYFFEGFLLSIATTCLPTACVAAYVNEFYKAERLNDLFLQPYIFQFGSAAEAPILVGALFWYVVSLVCLYLTWGLLTKAKKIIFNYAKRTSLAPEKNWSKANGTHTCS